LDAQALDWKREVDTFVIVWHPTNRNHGSSLFALGENACHSFTGSGFGSLSDIRSKTLDVSVSNFAQKLVLEH
jgi:hypothetical protein